MPILSGECANDKPVVDVALAPIPPRTTEVSASQDAPAFHVTRLRALLDTGADGTSISYTVARTHNLVNYGKRTVIGVGGPNTHDTWAAHLGIFYQQESDFEGDNHHTEGLFVLPGALMAVEIPDNQWFDIILGRDVLTQFDFSIRKGGRWELVLT
jgi:hypothetical protein